MPNLARSASPLSAPGSLSVRGPAGPASAADLLGALRVARAGRTLPGLDPASYARDHTAFEARSDQRGLIGDHLRSRLAALALRSDGPVSVLSVGCGDGVLDAPLAAALVDADPQRPVRYVGVEPWAGSAAGFEAALVGLGRPSLRARVHVATFEEYAAGVGAADAGSFDVVTFVHSLYYVPDLGAALRAAYDLLRPGGELVVLHAPRGALNELVDVLAPPLEGHRQWFGDDVVSALALAGLDAEVLALDARVELAAAPEEVLDFAVQARLAPDLRAPVHAYLDAVATPGPGDSRLVPHPVDAFRVVRPAVG